MARATRVDFPGAWYHILNEGEKGSRLYKTQKAIKETGFSCFTKQICIVFFP